MRKKFTSDSSEKVMPSISIVREVFHFARPYTLQYISNIFLCLIITGIAVSIPHAIRIAIDDAISNNDENALIKNGIYIGLLLFSINFLTGQYMRRIITNGQQVLLDIRNAVHDHIQKLSMSYFDKTTQGRVISRIDSDVEALSETITFSVDQISSAIATLVFASAIMLSYDLYLGGIVVLMLMPMLLATIIAKKYGVNAHRRTSEATSRITSNIAETVNGHSVIQAFSHEDANYDRFKNLADAHVVDSLRASMVGGIYNPFVVFLETLTLAIVLYIGGNACYEQDTMTIGKLVAFSLYTSMIFGPISLMVNVFNELLRATASVERILDVLKTTPEIEDIENPTPLENVNGVVEFENVFFRYPPRGEGKEATQTDYDDVKNTNEKVIEEKDRPWILNDITFRAEAENVIALVGETGAGKSSIINLVMRAYDVLQGSVKIDGIDIRELELHKLRRQMGIVLQENFLFSGTVMENLKFGNDTATDEEVKLAAKTLGVDDIIQGLSNGYNTLLKESAGVLSAGEKQILCLVRAMVANPRILILDEATSAVDTATEIRIQHAIEKLLERRTTFVVAHRLSTVRYADCVLVIDEGIIKERGTHDELLAKNGIYAKLYKEFVLNL